MDLILSSKSDRTKRDGEKMAKTKIVKKNTYMWHSRLKS